MLTTTILALALAPQGQGTSTAPVVINEFSYDDSGSNNRVFVELYNRTTGTVDISGWSLQGVDGSSSGNALVTIPPATTIAAGGFYVIGQAEASPPVALVGVPNVDLDVPTMNTVLETGPDGVVLLDTTQTPIDGVVWEYLRWTNPVPSWLEGSIYGDILNSDANPQSASRVFDGYDTNDNNCDFRVARWSPGTSNDAAHSSPQAFSSDFDGAAGNTLAADFNYSFVPGTIADPAALGMPASPQGGNVSTWFDPSGGGNANFLSAASSNNWVFETYAFLRGPAGSIVMDANDIETFAIGMGSTDSFGEPADIMLPLVNSPPVSLYGYAGASWQPGIRGIAWVQVIRQQYSDIYLVDFNDGGNDPTILTGPIGIPGPQWVRLRLSKIDGDLVCNFGGTLGCNDGQSQSFTGVTDCPGSMFVQYRENVSTPGAHRPLALDALRVAHNVSAATAQFGTGSPTVVGTPVINANSMPFIGNLAFSFEGSNLIPNGASFTMITIGEASLPGTQIPGAQPGALLHIDNVGATTVLRLNSSTGTTSLPCPIPCLTALTSMSIAGQIFDIDSGLSYSIPFGTSPGMTVMIGN